MKLIFLIAALTVALSAQSIRDNENGSTDPIEQIFLARDNGEGKPGEESTTFLPSDIPIFCVVTLKGFDIADVKMTLVAVRVAGVRPESKIVTASYRTKPGQNRVIFTGRPDGVWVSGNYRIDIFVSGVKVRSVTFNVADTPRRQNFSPAPTKRRLRKG